MERIRVGPRYIPVPNSVIAAGDDVKLAFLEESAEGRRRMGRRLQAATGARRSPFWGRGLVGPVTTAPGSLDGPGLDTLRLPSAEWRRWLRTYRERCEKEAERCARRAPTLHHHPEARTDHPGDWIVYPAGLAEVLALLERHLGITKIRKEWPALSPRWRDWLAGRRKFMNRASLERLEAACQALPATVRADALHNLRSAVLLGRERSGWRKRRDQGRRVAAELIRRQTARPPSAKVPPPAPSSLTPAVAKAFDWLRAQLSSGDTKEIIHLRMARALHTSRPAVSRTLRHLVQLGYVERGPFGQDRRSRTYRLNPFLLERDS